MNEERKQRKSVLVPIDLFFDICAYFFRVGDESPVVLDARITEQLRYKLEDMKRHDEYIPKSRNE